MKKKISKKKLIILIAVLLVIAGAATGILLNLRRGRSKAVHVETVASIMGGGEAGDNNRFAGVVESEKSWSVKTTAGSSVGEVLVKVGDTVKKGDPLFVYDTDKMKDSLAQAEIELQRLQNELKSTNDTIAELTREKQKASAQDQGEYTLEIQEQQLEASQTEGEIKQKQTEIDKLRKSLDHATVTSEIDGVVKSIKNDTDDFDMDSDMMDEEESDDSDISGDDSAFMTIMQTSALRIKASVNEQNIAGLEEGMAVIIHSRVDDTTWKGKITRIDTDSAQQGQQNSDMFMDEEADEETSSSSYPFYIELEKNDGLMLGQHVFVEPAAGSSGAGKEGIWLDEAYLEDVDSDSPYVWAENKKGKLKKRKVELGEYDDETMEFEITSGLTKDDRIAMPDDSLREGVKTQ